jgi:hypothetical protein
VVLAFDGFNSQSSMLLAPGYNITRDRAACSLSFLKRYHARGGRTKLETYSLLSAPRMQAAAGIVGAIGTIKLDELVFFIDLVQAAAKEPALAACGNGTADRRADLARVGVPIRTTPAG